MTLETSIDALESKDPMFLQDSFLPQSTGTMKTIIAAPHVLTDMKGTRSTYELTSSACPVREQFSASVCMLTSAQKNVLVHMRITDVIPQMYGQRLFVLNHKTTV